MALKKKKPAAKKRPTVKRKPAVKKAAPKKRNGVKAPAKKRPTVKRKPAVKKPIAKKRPAAKKRTVKRNGPTAAVASVKYAIKMNGKLIDEYLKLEAAKNEAHYIANKNRNIVLVNTMTRQHTGGYKLTAQRSIRPTIENPVKKTVKKAAPKKRNCAKPNPKKKNGLGSTIKKAVKKTIRKTVHKAAAKIASKTKNPIRKRNAEHRDADHPIEVTRYYRGGGPNFKTKWQRAHDAGQNQLFSVKNPKKRKPPVKKRTTRRNPANGTAYEMFTGQDYKGYFEMSVPASAPANLDELGKFYEFKWKDWDGKTHTVDFKKAGANVVLCCDRNRTRLWVAGNAKFPLPAGEHGEITQVTYQQKKLHLGDKEKTLYFHNLGEETGVRPTFQIDKDGRMLFKGGAYKIEADGIHN